MTAEHYSQLPLVTPRSVARTILHDGQTRLWFRKLFTSPLVIKRVDGSSGEGRRLYRQYCALSHAAAALLAAAGGAFLIGYFIVPQYLLVLLVLGASAGLASVMCWWRARQALSNLAAQLIEIERESIPNGVTLFQLGEIWSRKFGVPSMVDTIWFWDQCLRKSFLALYFAAFGVYFLPFWKVLIWSTAGCWLVIILVQLLVLARRKL